MGPLLWVILLEDGTWLHDDIGLLDSDLKDQPWGSVLHTLRTKVPSAKPSGLPPSQVVVAAFCRDDTHEHIKKVEMQKLSCPSGPFGVSSISLLFISPHQGPSDLKGPCCQAVKDIWARGLGPQPKLMKVQNVWLKKAQTHGTGYSKYVCWRNGL